MKITISRAAFIAAASVIQAHKDVRYYLNGILIEKGPDNHPIIVATDGHRLVAAIDENGLCSDDTPEQVIIGFGVETLRAAKLAKNLDSCIRIESAQTENDIDLTDTLVVNIGQSQFCDAKIIDGKFPEWRRVIANREGMSAGWFDVSYVADFEKVSRFLNADRRGSVNGITMRSDDENTSATIYFDHAPYAVGMLMPFKSSRKNPSLPAWAS